MIPAWCFIALRNFMGAVNRPQPALWVHIRGAAHVAVPCFDVRCQSAFDSSFEGRSRIVI
jgi:hypothetical protein